MSGEDSSSSNPIPKSVPARLQNETSKGNSDSDSTSNTASNDTTVATRRVRSSTAQIELQQSIWQGPLPPPQALAAYEKVKPGFAERILALAEKEAAHRHELDNALLAQESKVAACAPIERRRGQWLGFSLAGFVLITGAAFAVGGYPTQGATIIVGTVVSLAAVFVIGRVRSDKDAADPSAAKREQDAP